jgi:hypothetical protein
MPIFSAGRAVGEGQMWRERAAWVGITAAVLVVIAVVVVCVRLWVAFGTSQISTAGWVALILGILATLGLGGGLTALLIISNSRGYDDDVR